MTAAENPSTITVSAASPRRIVRARLAEGRITIAFGPGVLARMDDPTLNAEVKAALTGVVAGYDSAATPVPPKTGTDPAGGRGESMAADDPQVTYVKRVRQLDIRTRSPRHLVKARWSGAAGLDVKIRPETAGRLDVTEPQLAAEIEHAVNAAMEQYGSAVVRTYLDAFRYEF